MFLINDFHLSQEFQLNLNIYRSVLKHQKNLHKLQGVKMIFTSKLIQLHLANVKSNKKAKENMCKNEIIYPIISEEEMQSILIACLVRVIIQLP
jgi:predicted acetyltransferase